MLASADIGSDKKIQKTPKTFTQKERCASEIIPRHATHANGLCAPAARRTPAIGKSVSSYLPAPVTTAVKLTNPMTARGAAVSPPKCHVCRRTQRFPLNF